MRSGLATGPVAAFHHDRWCRALGWRVRGVSGLGFRVRKEFGARARRGGGAHNNRGRFPSTDARKKPFRTESSQVERMKINAF